MSVRSVRRATMTVVAVLIAWWPATAAAHPMPGVGDYYAGVLHPLTTLGSVLPLVALSLLAGQQIRRTAIAMLIAVPVALAFGAGAGLMWPMPAGLPVINAGAMAVLGVLVVVARPLPLALAITFGSVPCLAVGWVNGAEVTDEMSAYRFTAGLLTAGLLLVIYGVGSGRRFRAPWMRVGFRVLGSWIAAVGILLLGLG